MKKYLIPIIAILLAVIVGVLVWLIFFNNTVPSFTQKVKDTIKQVYLEEWLDSNENLYQVRPIIWYDENGNVEDNHVWRYIGTYGECYAFLKIGDNINNGINWEVEIPYPVAGLSRKVYYPIEAEVVLYHSKRTFTEREVFGGGSDERCSLWYLWQIDNRENWLTDAQLEQLTADIEKMANAK